MSTRETILGLANADARRFQDTAAREIRIARRELGVSQAAAARGAGMSRAQFSRLELGSNREPTLAQLCRAARAVGLKPAFKLYPDDVRVRDAAQLAMLGRFEALLAPSLARTLAREVTIPIPGDKRAWDARIGDGTNTASIECESRIEDVQALTRRIEVKRRDDPHAGVILLVLNKTAHNRALLREHREALRPGFPLDGAEIARSLRRGEVPRASGIILV